MDDLMKKFQGLADKNGDGKIDLNDLNELKDTAPDFFKQLSEKADTNGDGKVTIEDIKGLNPMEMLGGLGDKLGGMFGKK